MFQPKLLRRPLPPKAETERLPKRKRYKGAIEEGKGSRKILETNDAQPSAPDKSRSVYICFPDYDFGIQVPQRNFVIPFQYSGPPSFPMQKRRIPIRLKIPALREFPLHLDSDFILKGMAVVADLGFLSLPSEIIKPILSRCNYEVLTSQLIAEERRGPTEVSTIILSYGELPIIQRRKPERQMLIEKMLEEKSFLYETEESFPGEEDAKARKTVEGETSFLVKEKKKKRVTYADMEDDLGFAASFVSGVAFKPQSRVQDEESQLKTKAETAVSLSLTHRRTGLSLKAYFLSQLPDLSPLADFLLYLNLSFNCLSSFPTEVFCLKHLEVLKLRNNPIKFIPEEISQMKSLKYLVMSFNLLTSLPPG